MLSYALPLPFFNRFKEVKWVEKNIKPIKVKINICVAAYSSNMVESRAEYAVPFRKTVSEI